MSKLYIEVRRDTCNFEISGVPTDKAAQLARMISQYLGL